MDYFLHVKCSIDPFTKSYIFKTRAWPIPERDRKRTDKPCPQLQSAIDPL